MENDRKHRIVTLLSYGIQILRVGEYRNKLAIEGYLRPGYTIGEIERAADKYVSSIQHKRLDGRDLFLVKPRSSRRTVPHLNLILFAVTVLTTLAAGALMEGINIFKDPVMIYKGVPFSLTLMLILGVHELGHFTMAKRHQVDASLPYFIPAPTVIGTFGAFIRMRSPIQHRRALVEIGAAGPICGFIVALPALFIGLSLSQVVATTDQVGIQLGESLLMKFATYLVYPNLGENMDIMLHPIAFAAWIGMLVTMLNLLPIGQLDGGHIAYALLGKYYQRVAWGALGVILALSLFSMNWLVWAVLVFFLIRVKHPPVLDDHKSPTRRDKLIGIAALIIFILTFMPAPIRV